jgi:hypothetical protein
LQPNGNWPVPFTTGFRRVHKIQQENSGSFILAGVKTWD